MASAVFSSPLSFPTEKERVERHFNRIYETALKPLLANPERVQERISQNHYMTQLFFSDEEQTELAALFSIDRAPFEYEKVRDAMRVHFLHTHDPKLRKGLLLKAVAYAVAHKAQALIFQVTPNAKALKKFLVEQGFEVLHGGEKYIGMIHRKLDDLLKPTEAISGPALPQPAVYRSVTLMKKYIHLIRDGKKTIEGRINTGMFAAQKMRVGDGMRFFYKQNPHDDVHCTITGVKVFSTFREMLEHYGYEKCVPDTYSLEAAVGIYARIPNYSKREGEHGVVGIELRVDGHGPDGPANRSSGGAGGKHGRGDRDPYDRSTRRRTY